MHLVKNVRLWIIEVEAFYGGVLSLLTFTPSFNKCFLSGSPTSAKITQTRSAHKEGDAKTNSESVMNYCMNKNEMLLLITQFCKEKMCTSKNRRRKQFITRVDSIIRFPRTIKYPADVILTFLSPLRKSTHFFISRTRSIHDNFKDPPWDEKTGTSKKRCHLIFTKPVSVHL